MKYVGLQQQIKTNNRKSILLLLAFPFLVLAMVFLFFFIINYNEEGPPSLDLVLEQFINAIPMVFIAVGICFAIAYFSNIQLIKSAEKSLSLSFKNNLR